MVVGSKYSRPEKSKLSRKWSEWIPHNTDYIGKKARVDNEQYKIIVLIPTYNEAGNIVPLINMLQKLKFIDRVLIVDDGSKDGTLEKLMDLRSRYENIIVHQRNKKIGLGAAILDGLQIALARFQFTHIVTMDADFSHNPSFIPLMLASPADVVIGSRYIKGGQIIGWGIRRRLISLIGNSIVQMLLSLAAKDVTSGFRIYNRKAVALIVQKAGCRGFEFQVEALCIVCTSGLNIDEIPILFVNRLNGNSKLQSFPESTRFLKFVLINAIRGS